MQDQVVVITGGSGTLGTAMARGLLSDGARVFSISRKAEQAAQRVAEFAAEGLTLETIQGDVLDEESMAAAADHILTQAGRIDVLINAAGGNQRGATIMPDQSIFDLEMTQFRKVTDLNLAGTVIPSIAFAKAMTDSGKGCIINISSMAAQLPLTRVVGYAAAKAAVDNFTRWLAVELATKYGEGIRVNAIAPGFFIAQQNRSLLLQEDGTLTPRGETIISQTPMRRFGRPEELISTVRWLCDEGSSFVTGIVVPVDGGFSAFSGV